jgi:hypothetical protein
VRSCNICNLPGTNIRPGPEVVQRERARASPPSKKWFPFPVAGTVVTSAPFRQTALTIARRRRIWGMQTSDFFRSLPRTFRRCRRTGRPPAAAARRINGIADREELPGHGQVLQFLLAQGTPPANQFLVGSIHFGARGDARPGMVLSSQAMRLLRQRANYLALPRSIVSGRAGLASSLLFAGPQIARQPADPTRSHRSAVRQL